MTPVQVSQATASNLNAQVVGVAAAGAAVSGNPVSVSGSDGTNNVRLAVDSSGREKQAGYSSYSYISTNTTTTVKSSAGILRSIHVSVPGSGNSLTVYDANGGTTNPIIGIGAGTIAVSSFILNVAVSNGITVVTTGGSPSQVTVIYDFILAFPPLFMFGPLGTFWRRRRRSRCHADERIAA